MRLAFLLGVFVCGCAAHAPLRAPRPVPLSLAAQRAVDELAAASVLDFGYSRPSSYDAYKRLLASASREQIVALLAHPSPIVRGYMARAIIDEYPEEIAALEPLVGDQAPLEVRSFDIGMPFTVGWHVAAWLRESGEPTAAAVLGEAMRRSPAAALRSASFWPFVAEGAPADAIVIARRALSEKGELLGLALRTLGLAHDMASAPVIVAHAHDPDFSVRLGVVIALSALRVPEGLPLLRAMLDDPQLHKEAAAAYVRQPGFDPSLARSLAEANDTGSDTILALAESATPAAFEVLAAVDGFPPPSIPDITAVLVETDGGRALIARRDDLEEYRFLLSLRAHPADGPAFLQGAGKYARDKALEYALKHPTSWLVPSLEYLLDDPEPSVRQRAAGALVRLRWKASLPRLRRRIAAFPRDAALLGREVHRLERMR